MFVYLADESSNPPCGSWVGVILGVLGVFTIFCLLGGLGFVERIFEFICPNCKDDKEKLDASL